MFKTHKLLFLTLLALILFFSTFSGIFFWNISQINNSSYYKAPASQFFRFTTIKRKHQLTDNSLNEKPLLTKKQIASNFKAHENYLGSVAIPFNTYNKSINDTIIFRIKEKGGKNWYYQNTYNTNQFQTDIPFPFGFPIISDSKNKSYTFEIESLTGKPANAISLSSAPIFFTEYTFSKSKLKNPYELFQFIDAKIREELSRFTFLQYIFLITSFLLPFAIYYGVIKQVKNSFSLSSLPKLSANKVIEIILNFLLIVIVLNLSLISLVEMTYPYPREYRDGALIDIAHQFVIGSNPYTISNALPHTYTYGFISSLLDAFVSKTFSINLVVTQHLITFICMVLLCLIAGKEIFKATRNLSLVLVSLIIVLLYNAVNLRPESLAILLTISNLYFIHHSSTISFKRIILLSISIVTLFYIKQYFILLLPVICTYFIFNQPKKNLFYLLMTTLVLGLASFLIVNQLFPLYFPETIISYINYSGGPSTWVTHSSNYIIKQSVDFIQLNWLIFLLFLLAFLTGFVKDTVILFNVTDFNKPLLIFPKDSPISNVYFLYGFISILFLTFLLGYNGGAYLSYYFQLLPIPLSIFVICYFFPRLKKYPFNKAALIIVIVLFIFEHFTYLRIPTLNRTSQLLAWENAITYIEKHKKQEVYLSPIFTTEAVKREWPVYDNGQTDFYPVILLTSSTQQFSWVSPQDKDISSNLIRWQRKLDQRIIHKEFSLIVLPEKHHAILNDDYLAKYYSRKGKMDIPINFGDLGEPLNPLQMHSIEFWEPK